GVDLQAAFAAVEDDADLHALAVERLALGVRGQAARAELEGGAVGVLEDRGLGVGRLLIGIGVRVEAAEGAHPHGGLVLVEAPASDVELVWPLVPGVAVAGVPE